MISSQMSLPSIFIGAVTKIKACAQGNIGQALGRDGRRRHEAPTESRAEIGRLPTSAPAPEAGFRRT